MTKPTAPPTIAEAMRLADEYVREAVEAFDLRDDDDADMQADACRAALEAYLTQLLDHEAKASYALGYLDATQQPKEPE